MMMMEIHPLSCYFLLFISIVVVVAPFLYFLAYQVTERIFFTNKKKIQNPYGPSKCVPIVACGLPRDFR